MAAKAGTIITDAEGTQWRATQGGNWRAENGPKKGTLYKGKGDPVAAEAAPAASPGVLATTPVGLDTKPPMQLSPEGQAFIDNTRAELQKQVDSGAINQAQANYEVARREQELVNLSPALQAEKWRLQQQVNAGQLSQAQADTNAYHAQYNENQTAPNLSTNFDASTSGKDLVNTAFDVNKGAVQAGNVLTNPNEITDFGSKTVTLDPVTGQPVVQSSLSEPNRQVLGAIQGNALSASDVLGRLIAPNSMYDAYLQSAGPQSGYSDPALEEAVFGRLTKGFDDQKSRAAEQTAQTLANRGIPVGSEAYNNVMRDFENTWNDRYDAARAEATVQGTNTALQRQGNNISGLNSFVSGLNTFGALGQSGLYQPNFQQFNSVGYQQPNVEGVFNTLVDKNLTEQGFQVQKDLQNDQQSFQKGLIKSAGGGGGGGSGGGGSTKPAPFASAPPGS